MTMADPAKSCKSLYCNVAEGVGLTSGRLRRSSFVSRKPCGPLTRMPLRRSARTHLVLFFEERAGSNDVTLGPPGDIGPRRILQAEGVGFEPTSPFGRQFSSSAHPFACVCVWLYMASLRGFFTLDVFILLRVVASVCGKRCQNVAKPVPHVARRPSDSD